jgi:small subunit ribosomal protein S13
MVYLLETKLVETKSVFFALNHVYGIGKSRSFLVCKQLGFSSNFKVKNLSENQIAKLLKLVEISNITVGSELKKFKLLILRKLTSIKSYRGLRRINGLPVRGQRTHTNAKTAKFFKKKV